MVCSFHDVAPSHLELFIKYGDSCIIINVVICAFFLFILSITTYSYLCDKVSTTAEYESMNASTPWANWKQPMGCWRGIHLFDYGFKSGNEENMTLLCKDNLTDKNPCGPFTSLGRYCNTAASEARQLEWEARSDNTRLRDLNHQHTVPSPCSRKEEGCRLIDIADYLPAFFLSLSYFVW